MYTLLLPHPISHFTVKHPTKHEYASGTSSNISLHGETSNKTWICFWRLIQHLTSRWNILQSMNMLLAPHLTSHFTVKHPSKHEYASGASSNISLHGETSNKAWICFWRLTQHLSHCLTSTYLWAMHVSAFKCMPTTIRTQRKLVSNSRFYAFHTMLSGAIHCWGMQD